MNVDYSITDNCREVLLYEPTECLKLYNCLNIKDFNEEVKTVQFLHNANPSKSFKAKIVRTNDNQIFFGPAFQDIDNISQWTVQVNDVSYEINEDNFISIGSLLLPDVMKSTILYKYKKFRIINQDNDVHTFLSFDADFVNSKNTQSYGIPCIEIAFSGNEELSNFISENDNLYIQVLDNPRKALDVRLFIYVGGGYPFDVEGNARYKLILENLVYNTVEEKMISRFGHEERLSKSKYRFWLEDRNGATIETVNGLDFFEGKISIDTTSLQSSITFEASSISKKAPPALNQAFKVFY
jgi:hypothetical protein